MTFDHPHTHFDLRHSEISYRKQCYKNGQHKNHVGYGCWCIIQEKEKETKGKRGSGVAMVAKKMA